MCLISVKGVNYGMKVHCEPLEVKRPSLAWGGAAGGPRGQGESKEKIFHYFDICEQLLYWEAAVCTMVRIHGLRSRIHWILSLAQLSSVTVKSLTGLSLSAPIRKVTWSASRALFGRLNYMNEIMTKCIWSVLHNSWHSVWVAVFLTTTVIRCLGATKNKILTLPTEPRAVEKRE